MKSVVRWMLRATFSPPRCTYKPDNAIAVITLNNQVYYRTIFEYISPKGEKIMSSLWRDQTEEHPSKCLIYLHSLGANQFEVINIIPTICTKDLCVVAFDFPGCGLSDGQILPLDGSGAKLVKSCIDYLTKNYHFSEYALWGRSMGAAVALHAASMYNDRFKCVVADSSFASTEKILKDQGKANGFPTFLIKMLMPMIKREAIEDLKTNVDVPFPIDFVPNAKAPLLQGHGNKDRFVPCEHAKLIYDAYGGTDKQLNFFEGKHNSPRPNSWYEAVCRFLYRHLSIDEKPRNYDYVYLASKLHVGPIDQVLPDVLRVNEVLRQRSLQKRSNSRFAEEFNHIKHSQNLTQAENDQPNDGEYSDNSDYDSQESDGESNNNNYDYDYDDQTDKENQNNDEKVDENSHRIPQKIEDNESQISESNNDNVINQIENNSENQTILIQQPSNNDTIMVAKSHEPDSMQVQTQSEQEQKELAGESEQKDKLEDKEKIHKSQKKNKKRKEEKKRKHRKFLFDSLSEIGTDIDFGDKIENIKKEEESNEREEFNKSINHHHHHKHHRHHNKRISLRSTRPSVSNTHEIAHQNDEKSYQN